MQLISVYSPLIHAVISPQPTAFRRVFGVQGYEICFPWPFGYEGQWGGYSPGRSRQADFRVLIVCVHLDAGKPESCSFTIFRGLIILMEQRQTLLFNPCRTLISPLIASHYLLGSTMIYVHFLFPLLPSEHFNVGGPMHFLTSHCAHVVSDTQQELNTSLKK